MRVLIDTDACPVYRLAEAIARRRKVPVVLLCDQSHELVSDYSEVRVIGQGVDAVDLALINLCKRGDVVITQDYGVAAMALGRGALAMNQNGQEYTNDNIDLLLFQRHEAKKARMSSKKRYGKGPAKRTEADNQAFAQAFEALIHRLQK